MTKVGVKEIYIERAEGMAHECVPHTVTSYAEADRLIRSMAVTAPKTGGYDKTDFKVTFEDGETYDGRFDMTHEHATQSNMLQAQMRQFLGFMAGTYRPAHMADDRVWAGVRQRYAEQEAPAKEFLAKYDLEDVV